MNLNIYFYVLFTMSGVGFISWNNNRISFINMSVSEHLMVGTFISLPFLVIPSLGLA